MPRCYILKKHVNQSKSTVKDKPVLGDGNTTPSWQPKTSNVALKRHDTPISPTEVYASICYNNTLENQSGKCFLKFFIFFPSSLPRTLLHTCVVHQLRISPVMHYSALWRLCDYKLQLKHAVAVHDLIIKYLLSRRKMFFREFGCS